MNIHFHSMNHLSQSLWDKVDTHFLQVSLLLCTIWILDELVLKRFFPARHRYWVLLAVLVKSVVPGFWLLTRVTESAAASANLTLTSIEAGHAAVHSTPVVMAEPGPSLLTVALSVWALGCVMCVLALLYRQLRMNQVLRLASLENDIYWTRSTGPCVVGRLRPRILLPERLRSLSLNELELVLSHEREHIRRGDLWVRLVQHTIQSMFWFHPLVWLVNRRVDVLRELAVDQAVVKEHGAAQSYCNLLLKIAVPSRDHAQLGMASRRSSLGLRIEACLKGQPGRRVLRVLLPGLALLFALPSGCASTSRPASEGVFPALSEVYLERPEPGPALAAKNSDAKVKPVEDFKGQIRMDVQFLEVPTDQLPTSLTVPALLSMSGADLLSAPTIVTLSGQKASIEVGQAVVTPLSYIPGVDSESSTPTTFVTNTTGISLALLATFPDTVDADTPLDVLQASPLTLDVHAVLSELVDDVTAQTHTPLQQSHMMHQKIESHLQAHHGEATILGPVNSMRTVFVEDSVPVLGKIPLIGKMFGHREQFEERRSLFLILTPSVVDFKGKLAPKGR